MAREYERQQLTEPVAVKHVLNGKTVSPQPHYELNEADFVRLQGGPSKLSGFANLLAGGVVGYAITLYPKLEVLMMGGPSEFTKGEVRTVLAGGGVTLLLYVVGRYLPNDRQRVMKKISGYFAK